METNPDIYAIHALKIGSASIRLLYLYPGRENEPIEGTLSVVGLDQAGDFEALSYVWGDPSNPHHVTLDKTDFSVTANLYTALQFLRKPDAARTLWIDALCINQECVPEREYQVGLVRSIFSGAEIVLAWLGHPSVDGIVNLGADHWEGDDKVIHPKDLDNWHVDGDFFVGLFINYKMLHRH